MSSELTEAIVGIREDEALAIVDRMLDAGADPTAVLEQAKEAMTVLGQHFECGEAFVPELIMGGEIMKGISDRVRPRLNVAEGAKGATVVIGTVQGDIHDIGKDVVVLMLDVDGFDAKIATALLRPAAEGAVELIPIGTGVNRFANDDPSLQKPVGDPIRSAGGAKV